MHDKISAPATPASPAADWLRKAGIETTLGLNGIFSGLDPAELSAIADACRTRTLQKSEILFREGDEVEGLYVIQSGQICICRDAPGGRRQIIHVFGPGESFAQAALATQEAHPADAVALKPTKVILAPKAPLLESIARTPRLALNMLAAISLRMRALLQKLHTIKSRHAEGRLAAWLLENANDASNANDNTGGAQTVTLPMTKKLLAAQLGVQGETLSRMLSRFKKERVLDVSKRQIRIMDYARLEACADGRRVESVKRERNNDCSRGTGAVGGRGGGRCFDNAHRDVAPGKGKKYKARERASGSGDEKRGAGETTARQNGKTCRGVSGRRRR